MATEFIREKENGKIMIMMMKLEVEKKKREYSFNYLRITTIY